VVRLGCPPVIVPRPLGAVEAQQGFEYVVVPCSDDCVSANPTGSDPVIAATKPRIAPATSALRGGLLEPEPRVGDAALGWATDLHAYASVVPVAPIAAADAAQSITSTSPLPTRWTGMPSRTGFVASSRCRTPSTRPSASSSAYSSMRVGGSLPRSSGDADDAPGRAGALLHHRFGPAPEDADHGTVPTAAAPVRPGACRRRRCRPGQRCTRATSCRRRSPSGHRRRAGSR
jgi:hypothetical protein